MSLRSLTDQCGSNFPPGVKGRMYLTLTSELDSWPQTSAELGGSAQGDSKKLAENFVFKQGGYWRVYDILVDTGNNTDTLEGEIGGQGIVNRISFFVLGAGATQREFADQVVSNSGCLVALIVDKSGNNIVVGNLDDPAYVESLEGGTGTAPGDRVGYQYGLYANTGVTSMLYTGDLTTDPVPTDGQTISDPSGNLVSDPSGFIISAT